MIDLMEFFINFLGNILIYGSVSAFSFYLGKKHNEFKYSKEIDYLINQLNRLIKEINIISNIKHGESNE